MNVLSLFDGMSGGQLALQRANIPYTTYYASEVDKWAIQVTQRNFPATIQLGDIRDIDGTTLPKIDLLLGGSPCQGFSFAGKQLNFDDPRSVLFFEYVRILQETKPRYFLLENVIMVQKSQDVISKYLGVEPIRIDSALVSAQLRKRLYWTNIPNVTLPDDKHIYLRDIIEFGEVDREKSYCIDANYYKGGNPRSYFVKGRRQLVFNHKSHKRAQVRVDDSYRKLTVTEVERLQTVPEEYTSGVSNTQRYKMLGNGWTIDVIAHILKNMQKQVVDL